MMQCAMCIDANGDAFSLTSIDLFIVHKLFTMQCNAFHKHVPLNHYFHLEFGLNNNLDDLVNHPINIAVFGEHNRWIDYIYDMFWCHIDNWHCYRYHYQFFPCKISIRMETNRYTVQVNMNMVSWECLFRYNVSAMFVEMDEQPMLSSKLMNLKWERETNTMDKVNTE